MKFTKSCLIATAHPYLPQLYGGAQTCTDDIARLLQSNGTAQASVSAELLKTGKIGTIGRLTLKVGAKAAIDQSLGYRVFRAWSVVDAARCAIIKAKPDLAIVQSMGAAEVARECHRAGVPSIFYLHNVQQVDLKENLETLKSAFVSNSAYTQRHIMAGMGIRSTVIPPFYYSDKYKTDRLRADSVLFINPIAEKGVSRAIAIARLCPDIPFIFAEAWWYSDEKKQELLRMIGNLPNITVVPPRRNMTTLYSRARLLLMPSVWREAWGRVASEAHVSSIPVLASDVGGVSEAVGPGGTLFAPDAKDEDWAAELNKLWNDTQYYRSVSRRAGEYALRDQLCQAWQLQAWGESATAARRMI